MIGVQPEARSETLRSQTFASKAEMMFFMKPKSECSREDVQQAVSNPDCVIIDCRTSGEVAGGTVSGALVRDWMGGEFQAKSGELDPSKTYYLYCRSGNRSGQAAAFLKSQGFAKVYNAGAYDGLTGL